jgi:hypothetical protein
LGGEDGLKQTSGRSAARTLERAYAYGD